MNIEIHFLRHAVAVAEHLHFGNAAKSLHLSQPALSRSIVKLEQTLGQPIFIRGSRSVNTTDFGRLFIVKAKTLIAQVDNFSKELINVENEIFEHLNIGCGPYPAETVLPTALALFAQENPKVEQVVQVNSIENLLPQLFSKDGVQCIIAELSAVNLLPGLEITPMGKYPIAFVARSGHPLTNKQPTLQQLLHYPMVALARMPPRVFAPLHSVWKTVPATKRPALPGFECTSISLAKQIILRTDAFVAMQLSAIENELESGEFVILSTEPWLHLNYGFIQRKGFSKSNHLQEFKRILLHAEQKQAQEEKRLSRKYLSQ